MDPYLVNPTWTKPMILQEIKEWYRAWNTQREIGKALDRLANRVRPPHYNDLGYALGPNAPADVRARATASPFGRPIAALMARLKELSTL